jgi:integrase
MIQLQLRTGARPGEIVSVRTCDPKTTDAVWEYRPLEHKTEHRGKTRIIVIGPVGQAILRPFLSESVSDPLAFIFSPIDAEAERNRDRRRERKTSIDPRAVARPTEWRGRRPQARYSVASYRRAIERGCELAFGMPDDLRKIPATLPDEEKSRRRSLAAEWRRGNCWHPNQLRHSAATLIRQEFGLEGAQAVLGHANADVTQIYAKLDLERAREIAARIG